MIPYGKQEITDDDINAVVSVLKSDFLTQGPAVPKFENMISGYCKSEYAVAVNSATSALHIACLALGLGPGDWLWTSPISFVASANCGLYCGAKIDFVDIDPATLNMSIEALKIKLVEAEKTGTLPKILVPVHLGGQSCDMLAIFELSRKYGFKIIEDASHAVGGKYQGEPIGGCRYSDIAVFSFHPVKIITTAEGGIALTNDYFLSEKMRLFRSHGITSDITKMTHLPEGDWYYQQNELGFNYRLTDIQAALGCSQFIRLDNYVKKRNCIALRYDELLNDSPIVRQQILSACYSAFHLYIIRDRCSNSYEQHKSLFNYMRRNGVFVQKHYIPIHLQPFYKEKGFNPGDFPNAELYYREALSLPLFPTMSSAQQEEVVYWLKEAFRCQI